MYVCTYGISILQGRVCVRDWKRRTGKVDLDGSGEISYGEFAHWWTEMQLATLGAVDETTMGQMRAQWSAADMDGSGELSEAEFRIVMAAVADSEWKQVTDPSSGRTYYYHQKTKETRWVIPDSGTSSSIGIKCTTHALLSFTATSYITHRRETESALMYCDSEYRQKLLAGARRRTRPPCPLRGSRFRAWRTGKGATELSAKRKG